MSGPAHHRVFVLSVAWTLVLLWLGSVVHATGSSLACPDWPTCFGTMMPEMTGGVFWEHLHRLVAGGLILVFALGTVLAWRHERVPSGVRKWALFGVVALLIQAVLGGLTVILRLPDAISSAHLGLAFLFLALAVVLAIVTGPDWRHGSEPDPSRARTVRLGGLWAAGLVMAQSLLGAAVRHMEAGMACPDIPLCLGRLVPPLANHLIAVHYAHRVLGMVVLVAVVAVTMTILRTSGSGRIRALAMAAGITVTVQVALGFASVWTTLGVAAVSLHTLVAATLLSLLVALVTLAWHQEAHRTTGGAAVRPAATLGG